MGAGREIQETCFDKHHSQTLLLHKIVDPFTKVKSTKYMVKSKTKCISNLGAFSNSLKLNVQSIIFSKFSHEIEAAAICFAMERGRRKSQQNSRICVRAQIKLVYPV